MIFGTIRHVTIQRHPRRGGFTLIELLVVVAIMVILTSILIPSLRHAKNQARIAYCCNNLKQIYVGSEMYAQQNGDRYPDYWTVLGGWWYRVGAGMKYPPTDKWAREETYGLPAALESAGLTRGSKVWICPGAPEWQQKLKNTYVTMPETTSRPWSIWDMKKRQEGDEVNSSWNRGLDGKNPGNAWVWDFPTTYPYNSGFAVGKGLYPTGNNIYTATNPKLYNHLYKKTGASIYLNFTGEIYINRIESVEQ